MILLHPSPQSGSFSLPMARRLAPNFTAIALDSNYAPAHAVYSEILNDGQKWTQAFQEAETALRGFYKA